MSGQILSAFSFMSGSLTRTLYTILDRPITDSDRQRAALHVLDWLGCAALGSTQQPGRILAHTDGIFGDGECHIIGGSRASSAAAAAFANGGLGNILEMDDIHRTSILHPGPVIIPAVLAAAEAFGLSGRDFLRGLICGYECMIRIGRSVGPAHYANWHNTSSCGPFGAAAGVASALGLDADRFVAALGNAGSTASGLWRCRHEPVMTKQWHTARAAEDGLTAAVFAQRGLTGPEFILEGEQGFFAATAPDADPKAVIHEPDGDWLIYDTSFKPWPACRHAHATIDAALEARDALKDGIKQVASITIETYGDAARFCDRQTPNSEIEAKFSLQHAAAVALVSGAPGLEDFDRERRGDPVIAGLRDASVVRVTDQFQTAYPDHYGSALSVVLKDGSNHRFTAKDATGDPARPMSQAAIVQKAQTLMTAAGLTEDAVQAVINSALALCEAKNLEEFRACLP